MYRGRGLTASQPARRQADVEDRVNVWTSAAPGLWRDLEGSRQAHQWADSLGTLRISTIGS